MAPGRPRRDLAALHDRDAEPAQREVVGESAAGSSTTDDHDVGRRPAGSHFVHAMSVPSGSVPEPSYTPRPAGDGPLGPSPTGRGKPLLGYSTQSKVRVTAFFQNLYSLSRSPPSIDGFHS